MIVFLPIDLKTKGSVKDFFVPIAGPVAEHERMAGFDLLTSQLVVLRRRAKEVRHGRDPARQFIDCAAEKFLHRRRIGKWTSRLHAGVA